MLLQSATTTNNSNDINNNFNNNVNATSCTATVNDMDCNSCKVIPCLFFLRPEFRVDCSNVGDVRAMRNTAAVDTCRKSGIRGTPFLYWEPEQLGVDGMSFASWNSGSPSSLPLGGRAMMIASAVLVTYQMHR